MHMCHRGGTTSERCVGDSQRMACLVKQIYASRAAGGFTKQINCVVGNFLTNSDWHEAIRLRVAG
jgi:hypothetical protein